MCTVTFLPLGENNFVLTSNRDELKERVTLPPKKYTENEVQLLYPKDALAGGTWIGVSDKKRLVCVLNGGFTKHIREKAYLKSRGVIAKEVLKLNNLQQYIKLLDLNGVEPFTMIIVEWDKKNVSLFELIWDASKKHFSKLKNQPKIWSSSTLYSNEVKEQRKRWFADWLKSTTTNSNNILDFHHSEIGSKEQSILMKRSYIETVSITQVLKQNHQIEMRYEDVVHSEIYKSTLPS